MVATSGSSPTGVRRIQRRTRTRRSSFCATPSAMLMTNPRSAAGSRSSSMRAKKRRKTSWQRSWRSAPGPKNRRSSPSTIGEKRFHAARAAPRSRASRAAARATSSRAGRSDLIVDMSAFRSVMTADQGEYPANAHSP